MKKILLIASMMLFGMMAVAQTATSSHVIVAGETLYSISRNYGITVEDILKANPGLTENIMSGQTIKIPAASSNPEVKKLNPCKQTHLVQKKETIYGIAHQYGITEDELIAANPILSKGKLKKGTELCIPYTNQEKQVHHEKQQQVMEQIEEKRQESIVKYFDPIKIAVIAPFGLDEGARTQEGRKMVDFYRGFLMAVDTLKHKGVSCELYTYEETSDISSILAKPMLKHCNLIVGPFRPSDAVAVAQFAKENKIFMVAPMSLKSYDLSNNKYVYQVSSPQNYVLQNVFRRFIDKYSNTNVVFVNTNEAKTNDDFVNGLKKSLDGHSYTYHVVDVADAQALKDVLNQEKVNVLVPTSGNEQALKTLLQKLHNQGSALKDYRIRLFGYPDWQTFISKYSSQIEKYGTTFYTTFFSNPSNPNVRRFNHNYEHWFEHPQHNSFPKYAELGFDIAQYFVSGLKQYGSKFSSKTPVPYEGMQMPFRFSQQGENGGSYNNSVMFVTFKTDGSFSVER